MFDSPGNLAHRWRLRTLWLLLVIAAGDTQASFDADACELSLKNYVSPSGEFTLMVTPSDRTGAGAADYEMKRDGSVVWSETLPFAYWDAAVTDDGTAGGYAYSHGYCGGRDEEGEFIVAIIGPTGEIRQHQAVPRQEVSWFHAVPGPRAVGVFVDGMQERLVLRIRDEYGEADPETWWIYDLLNGVSPDRVPIEAHLEEPDGYCHSYAIEAQPVSGTPLTLLHRRYSLPDCPEGGRQWRSQFTLMGRDFSPIWEHSFEKRYDNEAAERADQVLKEITRSGAIFDSSDTAAFELRRLTDNHRVRFAVTHGDSGNWQVTEVDSEPYYPEEEPVADAPVVAELDLEPLGTIRLQGARRHDPPWNPYQFVLDDQGRFGFIDKTCRDKSDSVSLIVVDELWQAVHRIPVWSCAGAKNGTLHLAWIGDESWLIARSPYNDLEDLAQAKRYDAASDRLVELPAFDAVRVESMTASRDGITFALLRSGISYNSSMEIAAFNRQGERLWTVPEGEPGSTTSRGFDQIALTSSDELVVLERLNRFSVFGLDGTYHRTVELEQAWGREPEYLSSIAADHQGGILIEESQGDGQIVQMDTQGRILREIQPTFLGGRVLDLGRVMQVDADGGIWTSDGRAFMGLDEAGEVDRYVGPEADPNVLDEPVAIHIDSGNGIFVFDRRTAAVHVFDMDGERRAVAVPAVGDYSSIEWTGSLAVSADGKIWVGRQRKDWHSRGEFIRFASDGRRLDVITAPERAHYPNAYFNPGNGNYWLSGGKALYLIDAQGTVLQHIERMADGDWLGHASAAGVAPDGALAMVTGGLGDNDEVSLFAADGKPIANWRIPQNSLTWAGLAFDGSHLYFPGDADSNKRPDRVMVTDISGGMLYQGRFPEKSVMTKIFAVPGENGIELWVFDGESEIHRYRLPERF